MTTAKPARRPRRPAATREGRTLREYGILVTIIVVVAMAGLLGREMISPTSNAEADATSTPTISAPSESFLPEAS